jgi:hypothetical protein
MCLHRVSVRFGNYISSLSYGLIHWLFSLRITLEKKKYKTNRFCAAQFRSQFRKGTYINVSDDTWLRKSGTDPSRLWWDRSLEMQSNMKQLLLFKLVQWWKSCKNLIKGRDDPSEIPEIRSTATLPLETRVLPSSHKQMSKYDRKKFPWFAYTFEVRYLVFKLKTKMNWTKDKKRHACHVRKIQTYCLIINFNWHNDSFNFLQACSF